MTSRARRSAHPTSAIHVALFRGINVGGKNKLAMRDLVALFEKAGAEDVRSYIQSGNVLFRASAELVKALPTQLADQIAAKHGVRTSLTLRTGEELAAVVRDNPYLRDGASTELLHVLFLADAPDAARTASLDPNRSPPDAFTVSGREIYLHVHSMARTKLTNAYFDSKLKTIGTARNWRTVLTLLELCQG